MRPIAALLAGALLAPIPGLAAEPAIDDAAALQGVQEGRGVFLLDFDSPRKTALYMEVIRGTHRRLERQGAEPDLVVVFIGPTVQHLTTEPPDELDMRHGEQLASIRESARALADRGVRMEVCAVATDVFGVDNDSILPEMEVVGDGFVSLIGWQAQGYHLVPVF